MTLVNTDLHPSHDWLEEEENDFRYFMCGDCLICSCCYTVEKANPCEGEWEPDDED